MGRDAGEGMADAGRRDAGRVRLPDAGGPRDGGMPTPMGCVGASDGTPCSDGDGCTRGDACMAGRCVAGPREACSDGLACTTDVCVSTGADTFRCEAMPSTGGCDDGNACTTDDRCGADGTCSGTPTRDSSEPNDTRASARNLGSVSDTASYPFRTFTASLHPEGDEDWYRYFDSDDVGGAIYPRVDLRNIPAGSNYDLCAYYQCSSSFNSLSCASGTASTFEGLRGCCSNASGTTAERVRLDPDCSGTDDSGTVFVRVFRVSGPPTCADYTLDWGDD